MKRTTRSSHESSWENSSKWYDSLVGAKGHYYHEHVIFPRLLSLLSLKPGHDLLDLACGQGVLSRTLPAGVNYTGIDISPSLIASAKRTARSKTHQFLVGDATKSLPIKTTDFSHATILLALQNIADPQSALKNVAHHLKTGGTLCIVLNHPCFRIPRQSSWQVDAAKKIQYRRIDRYGSPLTIPITTNPGDQSSAETFSYHHPLSAYTSWLHDAGFVIEKLEEWYSDKTSTGGAARMENRARTEFPLFLALRAKKM
jgi:ubiquinone/menaquinone biosynthesis C-methylase UbiE